MDIIPAVDLKEGRCVRLLKGQRDQETVYDDDPVAMARHWEQKGANRLHIVDLDGAFEGKSKNQPVIEEIISDLSIPCQVGGGLRSPDAVASLLDVGADRAIIGTAGVENPDLFDDLLASHGPESIVAGVDCEAGEVMVSGWEEGSRLLLAEWVQELTNRGVQRVIYTDVDADGTQEGPDFDRTRWLLDQTDLNVIASGGVGSLDHLKEFAHMNHVQLEGVIVGRALYEGTFTLEEAQDTVAELSR